MTESFERTPEQSSESPYYTQQDIEHWHKRAQDYKRFYESLTEAERKVLFQSDLSDPEDITIRQVGDEEHIKALFLGEKPMALLGSRIYPPSLLEKLQSVDLDIDEQFVVDRKQLQNLIDTKRDFLIAMIFIALTKH